MTYNGARPARGIVPPTGVVTGKPPRVPSRRIGAPPSRSTRKRIIVSTLEDIDPGARELLALFALYARWGFSGAAMNWVIAGSPSHPGPECVIGILLVDDIPVGIPVGRAPSGGEARIDEAIAAWNQASHSAREALCRASLVWERDRAAAILMSLVRLGVALPSRHHGAEDVLGCN
jgi:hypothetical protein